MSINIQLQDKLLKLSGDTVTSDKITEALGYTPANLPNLLDDGSDNLMIADSDGNAIAKFDESGLTTTNVTTKSIQLDGEDLGSRLDSLESSSLPNILDDETGDLTIADENGNAIMKVDANGITTTNVNTKAIKLDGEDLGDKLDNLEAISLPNILDNESNDLVISDTSGNAIVRFDENGTTTTAVHAKEVFIDGENIATKVNEHLSDKTVHVTTQDKNKWDNKSDFSGNYNDLEDKPNVSNDLTENSLDVMDNNGNIIVTVNENGVTTTQVTTNKLILDSTDVATVLDEHDGKIDILNADKNTVGSVDKKISDAIKAENLSQYATDDDLSTHAGNKELHVTKALQDKWNAKAEVSYVDTKVADLVNSAPETLNTLDELANALGDDPNFATTVATQIGLKANRTELHEHKNKELLDAYTGSYNDLTDTPNILDDETDVYNISDTDGNIIFKVDKTGASVINMFLGDTNEDTLDVKSVLNNYILNIDETQYQLDTSTIVE